MSSVIFSGCNEDTEINAIEKTDEFVSIDIPKDYQAESNGERTSENDEDIDDVTLDVKIIVDGKEVIGKIRMIVHSDDKLSYFAVSGNIVDETNLSPDYWVDAYKNSLEGGRVAKTTGYCSDNYDKGSGRGACRAERILGIATTIIVIIVLL
ncbi:MAG: hypothetical protein ACI85I_000406 [Arenicella sp.]